MVGQSDHITDLLRAICEGINDKGEGETMGMTLAQYLFEKGEIEGAVFGQLRKAKEVAYKLLQRDMNPEEVADNPIGFTCC